MSLTREERILNTIHRKPVDYLPSNISFAAKNETHYQKISEGLGLSSHTQLDDFLENHIFMTNTMNDMPLYSMNDMNMLEKCQQLGYAGVDYENHEYYDRWGTGLKMYTDGMYVFYGILDGNKEIHKRAKKFLPEGLDPAILDMPIEEAIKHYTAPDVNKEGNFQPCIDALKEQSGTHLVVPMGYFGVFERAYGLMGWDNFLAFMMEEPVLAYEFMEKIINQKIETAKKMIELGFKIGHHGDDMGMQNMTFFSPKLFREMILPHLRKLFAVYKDAGIPVAMHSCGYIMDFLPDLINIGLDILEPVQPCNDLKTLKKEYGKDLIFWGGIDTQSLPTLSPDGVKELVKDTIRILGKGGGLIIAPSQTITMDVPVENIRAMLETIKEERHNID